jgi:citrate synthase
MSAVDSSGVKSRNEAFVEKTATKIWQEIPVQDNPYIAETCRCHGYDLIELMQKRSFVDVLYLLFRGELPTANEARLLEQLMIGLINPGPRHPATRAAMNAGVGKTDPVHILPIALSVYGGDYLGAGEIESAMQFLRQGRKNDPAQYAQTLLEQESPPAEGDWHIGPGFGSYYGGIDRMAAKLGEHLAKLAGDTATLEWGCAFVKILNGRDLGWLSTGVAAAVFTDLGIPPRQGAGLLQIIAAPGLFAHGIELANKPRTAMPYISDENYVIAKDR